MKKKKEDQKQNHQSIIKYAMKSSIDLSLKYAILQKCF